MGWTPPRPTSPETSPLLHLTNFGAHTGGRPLFERTTATVYRGVTVLAGPAKCGKTALLRTLAGLNAFHPQLSLEGSALLGTMNLSTELRTPERSSGLIAYVRMGAQVPVGTVGEYWGAPRSASTMARAEAVAEWWERPMASLSAGQRGRLALTRALRDDPLVLLVDDLERIEDPAVFSELLEELSQHGEERSIVLAMREVVTPLGEDTPRVEMSGRPTDGPSSRSRPCRPGLHPSQDHFCWLIPGQLGALSALPEACRGCSLFGLDRLGVTKVLDLSVLLHPSPVPQQRLVELATQLELSLERAEVVAVHGGPELALVVVILARVLVGRGRSPINAVEQVIERMGSIACADRMTQELFELEGTGGLSAALTAGARSSRSGCPR